MQSKQRRNCINVGAELNTDLYGLLFEFKWDITTIHVNGINCNTVIIEQKRLSKVSPNMGSKAKQ